MRKISVFGATGSIGSSTLDLIGKMEGIQLVALSAQDNAEKLAEISKKFAPQVVVIGSEKKYVTLKNLLKGQKTEIVVGEEGLLYAASQATDYTMMGISGAASIPVVDKILESTKALGVANKECVVCAGEILLDKAKKNNVTILPVDSEHNALFQILMAQDRRGVECLTLTASGGPFWQTPLNKLKTITPDQAARHPKWSMGAKISIDSATMMNKALEVIEASRLFDIPEDRIKVLIHPQSIVHALVEFQDGSSLAHLGMPDMRIPISLSLTYPERFKFDAPKLDLAKVKDLQFFALDNDRFPAVSLAREALRSGGSAPAIFNAANEEAVSSYRSGRLTFDRLVDVTQNVLSEMEITPIHNLSDVLEADRQARQKALETITHWHA